MESSRSPVDAGRLRLAIARLSRVLRRHSFAGLTPTQISTLASVERRGPLRLGDLAAYEGISPSTLSRPVAALEERGYLERRTDPEDARSSVVAVSEKGHTLLTSIREESITVLAGRLEMLSSDQRAALGAALPALERLADIDQPE